MADPRKFLYSSDYPTPAFVASWTGSVTVNGHSYSDTQFAHNLPFTPLLVGQWSLDPNFQPAFDIGTQNGWFVGVQFNQVIGSNSTNIKIMLNNDYDTQKTYYYRVFAFAPSDFDGDVPSIEDSTNYRFSSDFRNPKLFAYGHETLTSARDIDVYHNLGYVPQCRVWKMDDINKILSPAVNVHYEDGSNTSGQYVDTSALHIVGNLAGDEIYYHIYAEDNTV